MVNKFVTNLVQVFLGSENFQIYFQNIVASGWQPVKSSCNLHINIAML